MEAKPYVHIFDTTLRDGEQTPGVFLNQSQKVLLAEQLETLGVDTIEAGFPVSSPSDSNAVWAVAETVRRAEVAALARCVPGDIDAAVKALRPARHPVLHVFIGVSDLHVKWKLQTTRARVIQAIRDSIRYAAKRVETVQFSAEDATRAERIFLRQCVETAVEAGATRINLPDTVGCTLPEEYGDCVGDIVRFLDGACRVSAHCHNDLGLATANTIAAVRHGARQVEVTVNGLGERGGNAALEEVATILAVKKIARTGLVLSSLQEISARVAEETGVFVQPNRPVVGANAFAHSAGIHQDGILKYPPVYECYPPRMVGVMEHRFVLTARSGRHALAREAARMGYSLDAEEVDRLYLLFLERAEREGAAVSSETIRDLVESIRVSR